MGYDNRRNPFFVLKWLTILSLNASIVMPIPTQPSALLINPNVAVQKNDWLTTGIVYMPIGLAEFAAALQEAGFSLDVIDAFGEAPHSWWEMDRFCFRGLTPHSVVHRLRASYGAVVIYAINIASHVSVLALIRALKKSCPAVPLVILENTQAVTAYSLRQVQEEFYEAGADFIVTGEAEESGVALLRHITSTSWKEISSIPGVGFRQHGRIHYSVPTRPALSLDTLPLPAWHLFPLENYWRLGYAHAPLSSRRYLPLLTSRGCPYPCQFCVIPETNDRMWRAKSPQRVVDEMDGLSQRFHVTEFHIEDVDPTINEQRIQDICYLLLKRKLGFTWKLGSGTKVETLRDERTITLMAQAGCRYISISPESGSARVLNNMKKPFHDGHAKNMIRSMAASGIMSQACFVLGYPGEEERDRRLTWSMVRDFVRMGVDEIALFIIAPLPGSALFLEMRGYKSYSDLTFSPSWRQDYALLRRWMFKLYALFLFERLVRHPYRFVKQMKRSLTGGYETKMEMTLKRAWDTARGMLFSKGAPSLDSPVDPLRLASPSVPPLASHHDCLNDKAHAASARAPLLSVIVPCYNEARTIRHVVLSVAEQAACVRQIIVVDDGSNTDTQEAITTLLQGWNHPLIQLHALRINKNRGKGAAVKAGLAIATQDYSLIQDADAELNPNDYRFLMAPILAGEAQVVFGDRFGFGVPPDVSLFSRVANWIVTQLSNGLYGLHLRDQACGYKLFPTKLGQALNLQSDGFEICSEMTAKMGKRGIRIANVSVAYQPRTEREGKKIRWVDGCASVFTLLRYRL